MSMLDKRVETEVKSLVETGTRILKRVHASQGRQAGKIKTIAPTGLCHLVQGCGLAATQGFHKHMSSTPTGLRQEMKWGERFV